MLQQFDVAIVGGGPAGSTTAALLAKRGYNVLLVEKEKFPRYHIGESLVPGVRYVLEELGLSEVMAQYGFTVKNGITLRWGKHREPWTVYFGEHGGPFRHAYQVVRSEFDNLLLQHARHVNAMVLEETRVVDFVFEDGRCIGFKYIMGGNREREQTVRARFIVDASGQTAFLSRKMGYLEWDSALKNIATWAYYQGGKTLSGRDAGNILTENMPDGWLWHIPLHDGTQSVGWVTPTENVNDRKALEQILQVKVANSLEIKQLLDSAYRVSAFHTARDWSYKSKQLYGLGFLLTGDAAGFVDPLFSTGVFLAMNGGSLAAKIVDYILRKPDQEQEALLQYEERYRTFLDKVFSLIHFFYDASKDKEQYWAHAQQLVDPIKVMTSRQDFIYMISGVGGVHKISDLDPKSAITELTHEVTHSDAF